MGGRKSTSVPAGAFDTVYVYRIVQLDDDEFWRTRTTRRDAVWYAPDVKAPVREARVAEYTEKGGGRDTSIITTENTIAELVSFKPGANPRPCAVQEYIRIGLADPENLTDLRRA